MTTHRKNAEKSTRLSDRLNLDFCQRYEAKKIPNIYNSLNKKVSTDCFLLHLLLEHCNLLNIDISQGSVATRLRCGGVFEYNFVTNFLLSITVKLV